MGLKTDESSIHVLPPDEDKHKTTSATVESNLLDTNPDLYVKRAKYFVRKGMFAEAENEYNAAILFSHKAGKYYSEKARFYKDVLHDKKRSDALFNLDAFKTMGWFFLIVIGANLIAAGLDLYYPFRANAISVLGLFLLLAGVFIFATKFEHGVMWFGMELLMLGAIVLIYRLFDIYTDKIGSIALKVSIVLSILLAVVFAGMVIMQLFSRIKRGTLRLFSKKQTFSDAELDAMGIIEPTPLEEVRRICRTENLTILRMLLVRALIIGIVLAVLLFVSGKFKTPSHSETANRVMDTVDNTAEAAQEIEPQATQTDSLDLSPEEQQAIIEDYFGCDERDLQQIGYMYIGDTERKVWRHTEGSTDVLFYLDIDSVVRTQGDNVLMERDYFHPYSVNRAPVSDEKSSISTIPDISLSSTASGISSALYAVLSGEEPFINHGYYDSIEEYQYCDKVIDYTEYKDRKSVV